MAWSSTCNAAGGYSVALIVATVVLAGLWRIRTLICRVLRLNSDLGGADKRNQMNHDAESGFLEALGRILGVEGGRPPDYYRDFILALVLTGAFTVAVAAAPQWPHPPAAFWWGCAVSSGSVLLAKRRRGLVAIALASVALRLGIAFLVRWHVSLFLGAVAFGAAAIALAKTTNDFEN